VGEVVEHDHSNHDQGDRVRSSRSSRVLTITSGLKLSYEGVKSNDDRHQEPYQASAITRHLKPLQKATKELY
jgi:hypothetical protein